MCTRSDLLDSVSKSSTTGGFLPKMLFSYNLLMERDARVLWICVALLVPLVAVGIVFSLPL